MAHIDYTVGPATCTGCETDPFLGSQACTTPLGPNLGNITFNTKIAMFQPLSNMQKMQWIMSKQQATNPRFGANSFQQQNAKISSRASPVPGVF